jgi:hypothetical protein
VVSTPSPLAAPPGRARREHRNAPDAAGDSGQRPADSDCSTWSRGTNAHDPSWPYGRVQVRPVWRWSSAQAPCRATPSSTDALWRSWRWCGAALTGMVAPLRWSAPGPRTSLVRPRAARWHYLRTLRRRCVARVPGE